MFVLCLAEDKIRIMPTDFHKERVRALTDTINDKYGNKVFPECGLCITVYDILDIGDAYIYPGDGAAHITCTVRLLVFRPFADECMEGTVMACSSQGIRISVGFFDDIHVTPDLMPDPSE
eukprot:c11672_g1_i1.p1 GENE.c11672_g1_i1~~c11672_g1_i1.p1  ORF type:complete len:129 (-),score=22.85 c11672_g1_i1:44-403(-)